MLTESQLSFFKTFGCVTMKNVFTPAELRTLDGESGFKRHEDAWRAYVLPYCV